MATSGNKTGLGEMLSKVRVPRKLKEATQLGTSYQPTQAGIQFSDEVKAELETRSAAYDKALEGFKEIGGEGIISEDGREVTLSLDGKSIKISDLGDGQKRIVQDFTVSDDYETKQQTKKDLITLANAFTAYQGMAKSSAALAMVKQLRSYLENDGYIKGLNGMANDFILTNPVMLAASMIPEDRKEETDPDLPQQSKTVGRRSRG